MNKDVIQKMEETLKFIFLGSSSKKNEILRDYASTWFEENHLETLGVDILTKIITVKTIEAKIILVNISPDEVFREYRARYYHEASCIVIIFDKSSSSSFKISKKCYDEVKDVFNEELSGIPIAIIGFTSDNEKVSEDEVDSFVKVVGADYFDIEVTNKSILQTILPLLARKYLELRTFSTLYDRIEEIQKVLREI